MKLVDSINKFSSKIPDTAKIFSARLFDKIPNSLIYGKMYRKTRKFLDESQYYDRDQINEMQFLKLKEIVSECYRKSSFYGCFYKEHGFSPEMLKDISDINKIPLIDKSIVRNEIKNISISLPFKYFVSTSHTGGTSSSPMFFPETIESKFLERAFNDRLYCWHGLKVTDSKISLKGAPASHNGSWFYNFFLKSTIFPLWDISEVGITRYSKVIQKIKPEAIVFSYPSLVYAYAKAINSGLIPEPISIKKIFCSSETLFSYQIKEIQKAFGITPVDYYGQNERVSLIQQCINHEFHIIPEYGITEILDENNKQLTKEGEVGEIVGTGFLNRAFPLIRYRTGDLAVVGSNNTCSCRLPYKRIKRIEGRSGDFILTPSGKLVSPTVIEFAIRYIKNFKDVEIVQTDIDTLEIWVVPDTLYDKKEGGRFAEGVKAMIGEEISVRITLVDEIERPLSQKRRFIKSEFPISGKKNERRRSLIPHDLGDVKNRDKLYVERGYGDILGYSDEEYLKM
jgi:phenylacetate-CoA ligase